MEVPATLAVLPWADPVIDPIGHDPRSRYVELFWLGVLGPTATLLLRRFADGLESYPDGFELDVPDLARSLGIKLQGQRRAAFANALQRTVLFGMAQHHSHGLLVRRRMPPLSHRQVAQLPADLRRAICQLARTPRLLVASDYDGTLAPIVSDPEQARPLPESVNALRSLASLHETTSAVISGRALRDLATLSRLPGEVHLVGSHGSEFDVGFVHALDADAKALLRRIESELEQIVDGHEGVHLEVKPAEHRDVQRLLAAALAKALVQRAGLEHRVIHSARPRQD